MKNWLHDPIWFTAPNGSSRVLWKDSPSPPPAPDYSGAATATAQGNLENAKYATNANRINQYSPYGSLTYSRRPPADSTFNWNGGTYSDEGALRGALGDYATQNGLDASSVDTWLGDQEKYGITSNDDGSGWSQQINLSPVGQKLLDYANQSALGLGQQQGQALDRVNDTLAQPMNMGSAQDATDQAYSQITSRLDPEWSQQQQLQEAKLRNQGLVPGGEAYDNAMRVFNQGRNDAYTQARTQAMNFAPQTYQLDVAARNQPLNELNALRTGSQVTNPQFSSVPQQQTMPGANYLGAAQSQGAYDQNVYNQGVNQANSFNSGLMSIGGAALGASGMPWWMPK